MSMMMLRRRVIGVASAVVIVPIWAAIVVRLAGAQNPLPSGIYSYDQLPIQKNSTTDIRQMLTGLTHSGYRIDLHETALAPGQTPHAPHRHVHEELMLVREGTVEVTVGTKSMRVGPGSAVYIASNDEHGWRNVGPTPAKYFVMALGEDK